MFFYRCNPNAKPPVRKNSDDAGWDFFSAVGETVIRPGEIVKVPTGIVLGLSTHAFGWDRSGLGSNGVKTFGGVIDKPYVGEINIVLGNMNTWRLFELIADSPSVYNSSDGSYTSQIDTTDFRQAVQDATVTIPSDKAVGQLIFDTKEMVELTEEQFRREFRHKFETGRGTKGFGSSDPGVSDEGFQV